MVIKPEELHRRSIRLPGYDYSQPGAYFVTLVTDGRVCLFGEVVGEEMRLNEIGQVINEEWFRTPTIRPEIELGAFQVMPNHIHGILVIRESPLNRVGDGETIRQIVVGAHGRAPLPVRTPRSLGSVVAGYKSVTTRRINELRRTPGHPLWQRNYYEHVIRNEADWDRIHRYILANPLLWPTDEENR